MEVAIVGEDQATKDIIKRIIHYVGNIEIAYDLPARGGKILSMIREFNNLSHSIPVVLLTDLDQYNCPPELLNKWFEKFSRNEDFHVRVAVDEAEAWLMADREGFSNYFSLPIERIPQSISKSRIAPDKNEMSFPYKSSYFLGREIIPYSTSSNIKKDMTPKSGSTKGPLYNSRISPFIKNNWDIRRAQENSYSLRRTIARMQALAS